jgi:[acyl-carrier-protein] S-malonyltransferase
VLALDDDKVAAACEQVDGDVWVANYNAPGQVVIAGDADAITAAGAIAKDLGAKRTMGLPVGGAFHTPFMAPASDRLRTAIADTEIRDPDLPVVANVDAAVHLSADEWRGLLGDQLCSPVRWRQSLYTLDDLGCTTYVELGPGTVLTGMVKRTLRNAHTLSVATPDELDALLEALHGHEGPPAGFHEGEHLFATERVVVSPAAGIFRPDPSLDAGLDLTVGQRIGSVGDQAVLSQFRGSVVGVLAVDGERVTNSQPIAWLRSAP